MTYQHKEELQDKLRTLVDLYQNDPDQTLRKLDAYLKDAELVGLQDARSVAYRVGDDHCEYCCEIHAVLEDRIKTNLDR